MNKVLMIGLLAIVSAQATAQKYSTRTGFIGFYSKTPLEDVQGENHQAYAVIDLGSKNLAVAVLLKGFIFPKELMQEHFNENYVESDKYPKATFSGSFAGDVAPGKDGTYNVIVHGNLTLHGVTKAVDVPAVLTLKGETITGTATFQVIPEDYNIGIPSIVRDKIAKNMRVEVNLNCAAS